MRRVILKRLIVCIPVFGLVWLYVWGLHRYDVQSWIVDAGQRMGLQVTNMSGHIIWMEGGPFFGSGPRMRVANWIASNGVYTGGACAGFLGAAGAYGLCAWAYRWRPLGYRGRTRCGACGYGLSGLREPRCPECGRVV